MSIINIFTTSDTHFNHANIIKYCNRPFSSTKEMDEALIKNWNSVVSNKDVVLHLGDFGLGNKEYIAGIIKRLHGKKILIMGNHDNWSEKFYKDAGFDVVSRFPILYDKWYLCSHAPLQMFQGVPYMNLYGHVHDDPVYCDTENAKCVCVERTNYTPVLLYSKN